MNDAIKSSSIGTGRGIKDAGIKTSTEWREREEDERRDGEVVEKTIKI